ncbi:MAG: 50S ribosomal protein L13 [Planctomycetota bacterium]|jgi:large subunit ribosomal protein L13
MNKTTFSTTNRADAKWYVVDASQEILGRMAARISGLLQGKHKPTYTPHADVGDFVVVTNAAKVRLSGRKAEKKVYRHHTGYPGGLVEQSYARMKENRPEEIVRLAVRRMMPKTTMGRHMLKKLKIYPGAEHPHHAQKPESLSFGTTAEARGTKE